MERMNATQKMRERISAGKVLDRLLLAFNGEIELTQTQATIGLRLVNKIVPDLKAIEHSGETTQTHSIDPQSSEQVARNVLQLLNAARS